MDKSWLKPCGKLNIPIFFVYIIHPKRFAESSPNLKPLNKSMPDLNNRPNSLCRTGLSWEFFFQAWTWHTWPLWFLYVLCFFWSPHFAPATMTLWLSVSVGSQLGQRQIPRCFWRFLRWLRLEKCFKHNTTK